MITTIILLSVICIILAYICINLYYKNVKYEQFIGGSREYYDSAVALLERLIKLFIEAKYRMGKIEAKGSFETDDEVGFAFKLIDSVIIETSSKLDEIKEIIDNAEN